MYTSNCIYPSYTQNFKLHCIVVLKKNMHNTYIQNKYTHIYSYLHFLIKVLTSKIHCSKFTNLTHENACIILCFHFFMTKNILCYNHYVGINTAINLQIQFTNLWFIESTLCWKYICKPFYSSITSVPNLPNFFFLAKKANISK